MNIEDVEGIILINGFKTDEYTEEGQFKIKVFLRRVLKELGDHSV